MTKTEAQMTKTEIRRIIRAAAAERQAAYRITRDGEVHFYGVMPNTNHTGWYFIGFDAEAVAREFPRSRMDTASTSTR